MSRSPHPRRIGERHHFEKTVDDLTESGARVIQSEDLDGIAFVHPKSTHGVLLQVMEKKP